MQRLPLGHSTLTTANGHWCKPSSYVRLVDQLHLALLEVISVISIVKMVVFDAAHSSEWNSMGESVGSSGSLPSGDYGQQQEDWQKHRYSQGRSQLEM